MAQITEADVYHILSYNIWKSGLEIRDELKRAKDIENPLEVLETKTKLQSVIEDFKDINIVTIYVNLDSLEEQGFAEHRERELPPERLAVRGGKPEIEYHLTQTGMQNRHKYEIREVFGLESRLCPAI